MELQAVPSIFGNGREPTDILHLRGKIFHLFDLPRELRDDIYERVVNERTITFNADEAAIRVVNPPRGHLLLVSHRFRDEYNERVSKTCSMHAIGQIYRPSLDVPSALRSMPASVLKMKVVLKASQDGARKGLDSLMQSTDFKNLQTHLLDVVAKFKTVREVSIALYLRMDGGLRVHGLTQLQSALSPLIGSGAFTTFNVYRQDNMQHELQSEPWQFDILRKGDRLILSYCQESPELRIVDKKK